MKVCWLVNWFVLSFVFFCCRDFSKRPNLIFIKLGKGVQNYRSKTTNVLKDQGQIQVTTTVFKIFKSQIFGKVGSLKLYSPNLAINKCWPTINTLGMKYDFSITSRWRPAILPQKIRKRNVSFNLVTQLCLPVVRLQYI